MRWLDGITNPWTWVWAGSGRWRRTRKPGVLQFMGLQRVGHNWVNNNKKIKMTLMLLPHLRPADSVSPGWGRALVFLRSSPEWLWSTTMIENFGCQRPVSSGTRGFLPRFPLNHWRSRKKHWCRVPKARIYAVIGLGCSQKTESFFKDSPADSNAAKFESHLLHSPSWTKNEHQPHQLGHVRNFKSGTPPQTTESEPLSWSPVSGF